MSLRRLTKSFMTIQTSEGAGQTNIGSINRADSWANLPDFVNIKCHVQEKSKQTVTERFSRLDEEHNDLIYHQNLALKNYRPADQQNQTQLRIITNRIDTTKPLVFPVNEEIDIKIYDWMGHIEQVATKRKRHKFFILRCQHDHRSS